MRYSYIFINAILSDFNGPVASLNNLSMRTKHEKAIDARKHQCLLIGITSFCLLSYKIMNIANHINKQTYFLVLILIICITILEVFQ